MQDTLPEREAARLQALSDYHILDTAAEAEFDDFTVLAAHVCGAPIAVISLIDSDRQWFKSKTGIDASETPRDQAFCAHALHQPGVFTVPDAQADARFAESPLVSGEANMRFYAGAPLVTEEGHVLGTLCVIDHSPRTLTAEQERALQALSRQVIARLELRRHLAEREKTERKLRAGEALKAAILQSALDCIITINQDGQVLEWNPAAETTFGYRREEVLGCDLADLIVPHSLREAHRHGMAHYLKTGEGPVLEKRIEIKAIRSDGSELPVELAITPIRLEGEAPVFTATVRDISSRKQAEQTLRDQEEQYRLLFENSPNGIYRTTPDGHILLANPALLAMLGYDNFEQLAARNLEAEGAEANYDREEFKARLEAAGELRELETVWKKRDGQQISVRESAHLVRGMDGLPLYYEGSVEDITARKEAEEALRQAHEELERRVVERTEALDQMRRQNEMLLTTAGEGIYGIDHQGCTTFINPAAARMLGWDAAALLGKPMHALLHHTHPDGSPFLRETCPIHDSLQSGTVHHVEDELFWRQDGTSFAVEYISTPLREDGQIVGAVVTFQDITERKREQAALAESEQRYRSLVEHSPDGIVVYSDDRLMYLNEAALKLLGAETQEQLLGCSALEQVHPDWRDKARERARLSQSQNQGSALEEFQYLRMDGSAVDVEAVSTPILFEGKPAGQVLIRDITERKQAEKEIYRLHAELTQAYEQTLNAYDATIEGLSRALDYRDHETEGHSRRVTELTMRLARALNMNEEELVHVRRGALLHDIGKMGVPDRVLLKPGPLDDIEWEAMRRHPSLAHEMLWPIAFLRPALNIPYSHHEKWDGTGYPRCLEGEEIPLAARMFAVVDVWDALRSDRPYRKAWSRERVLQHIRRLSGTHFDPQVVDAFLALMAERSKQATLTQAA